MKEKIHPEYFTATATCACGATYEIASNKKSVRVDICSACHPLFTGKQKLLDTEGRVQRFKKKYAGVKIVKKAKKKVKRRPTARKKKPSKKKK